MQAVLDEATFFGMPDMFSDKLQKNERTLKFERRSIVRLSSRNDASAAFRIRSGDELVIESVEGEGKIMLLRTSFPASKDFTPTHRDPLCVWDPKKKDQRPVKLRVGTSTHEDEEEVLEFFIARGKPCSAVVTILQTFEMPTIAQVL
eukprot:m.237835 g.237835  ORF g.237835 m.237835 type:complete len:147 (+) comp10911_c0_seq8:112-552(+)